MGAFSSFLSQDYALFHWWKAKLDFKLSHSLWRSENDQLHIYGLCLGHYGCKYDFFADTMYFDP